jgi:hypothetical protein
MRHQLSWPFIALAAVLLVETAVPYAGTTV